MQLERAWRARRSAKGTACGASSEVHPASRSEAASFRERGQRRSQLGWHLLELAAHEGSRSLQAVAVAVAGLLDELEVSRDGAAHAGRVERRACAGRGGHPHVAVDIASARAAAGRALESRRREERGEREGESGTAQSRSSRLAAEFGLDAGPRFGQTLSLSRLNVTMQTRARAS